MYLFTPHQSSRAFFLRLPSLVGKTTVENPLGYSWMIFSSGLFSFLHKKTKIPVDQES